MFKIEEAEYERDVTCLVNMELGRRLAKNHNTGRERSWGNRKVLLVGMRLKG